MSKRVEKAKRAKTHRGRRILEQKSPKIEENVKSALFIRGSRTSDIVTKTMRDLCAIKKPHSTFFQRKNIIRPFEDQTTLEHFSRNSDASLFVFGSHSKKRPHNLVFGRMFDYQVADMIELGIDSFKAAKDFKVSNCAVGCKPCIVFTGSRFEETEELQKFRNLMLDFFRQSVVKKISLKGLERVISFAAEGDKIYMRNYRMVLKKSGTPIPRVELVEIGPSLDFTLRRCHLASKEVMKAAMKKPKEATIKKKKNVDHDPFGSQLGRIHMQRQDLGTLQTKRVKALKSQRQRKRKPLENDEPADPSSSLPKKSKTSAD